MKPEDDSEAGAVKSCETPGCDKEAKLQCPTCIKLQIKVSIRSTSDLGGKQLGLSIIIEVFDLFLFLNRKLQPFSTFLWL